MMSEFTRRPWQLLTGTPTERAAKSEKSRLDGVLRAKKSQQQKKNWA